MGSFPKAKPNNTHTDTNTNTHNRVMGFLLVFFPEENNNTTPTIATKSTKPNLVSSSPSPHSLKRISSSSNNALLSKAQSTISICFLLLFTTLLLFTLSTFEPTHHKPRSIPPKSKLRKNTSSSDVAFPSTALQRMGTLYRRGTRAMNDIVVCHVPEDTTHDEFRIFLRLLHRSGLTSKSDVVFIFVSASSSTTFAHIVHEENTSFLSLINLHAQLNSTQWAKPSESNFDATRFLKAPKKGEPLWGKKIRTNYSGSEGELSRASYGSVLSFDANELDPENSLAGFLDRVPLSLRRWACYPMLLGRVRRNFKHVTLVDVKNVVIFNDPLGRVRNQSPESVFVYPNAKHGRNSERTQSHHPVNSVILMGGARGIRRVSHAMLVAIVRASMQPHKRKNSVSDSAILSQLVRNKFALRNVHLIVSGESIPEASSLAGSTSFSDCTIIQRGTGNYYDLNSIVKKQICSSVMDSFVYNSDCKHQVKVEQ
ncbi:hypothetical protein JHK87_004490 [Glycine soja]|nr:hypothetical protein JHK87_004490 [Glycine soja]